MEPATRIKLIQGLRDELQPMSLEDEALVLEEFGIGARPTGEPFDEGLTLTQWLQQAEESKLVMLARYLDVLPPATPATTDEEDVEALPDQEPESLFLFASHVSAERTFVGDVERALGTYGVQLFVAHDSIPMDADWQPEIAEALKKCHGGVAFIHAGFNKSVYCQQEVGWLMGREVPVARYLSGETPAALLSRRQGKSIRDFTADETADEILNYAKSQPDLLGPLVTSLSHALVRSASFGKTDKIWSAMPENYDLTSTQAERLLAAAEGNGQVYRANVGGWRGEGYRFAIARLLERQGFPELRDRIARLRENATNGKDLSESDD